MPDFENKHHNAILIRSVTVTTVDERELVIPAGESVYFDFVKGLVVWDGHYISLTFDLIQFLN